MVLATERSIDEVLERLERELRKPARLDSVAQGLIYNKIMSLLKFFGEPYVSMRSPAEILPVVAKYFLRSTMKEFPEITPSRLVSGMQFHDTQVLVDHLGYVSFSGIKNGLVHEVLEINSQPVFLHYGDSDSGFNGKRPLIEEICEASSHFRKVKIGKIREEGASQKIVIPNRNGLIEVAEGIYKNLPAKRGAEGFRQHGINYSVLDPLFRSVLTQHFGFSTFELGNLDFKYNDELGDDKAREQFLEFIDGCMQHFVHGYRGVSRDRYSFLSSQSQISNYVGMHKRVKAAYRAMQELRESEKLDFKDGKDFTHVHGVIQYQAEYIGTVDVVVMSTVFNNPGLESVGRAFIKHTGKHPFLLCITLPDKHDFEHSRQDFGLQSTENRLGNTMVAYWSPAKLQS